MQGIAQTAPERPLGALVAHSDRRPGPSQRSDLLRASMPAMQLRGLAAPPASRLLHRTADIRRGEAMAEEDRGQGQINNPPMRPLPARGPLTLPAAGVVD